MQETIIIANRLVSESTSEYAHAQGSLLYAGKVVS
jgi:hypothetical protein